MFFSASFFPQPFPFITDDPITQPPPENKTAARFRPVKLVQEIVHRSLFVWLQRNTTVNGLLQKFTNSAILSGPNLGNPLCNSRFHRIRIPAQTCFDSTNFQEIQKLPLHVHRTFLYAPTVVGTVLTPQKQDP